MRIDKYAGLAVGTFALMAGVLAVPLWADDQTDSNKYDAVIKMAMASPNSARRLSAMTCAKGERGTDDNIRVLVKTTDKGTQVQEYLSRNGGRVNSRHGHIVSLTLPYRALSGLSKLASVSYIEASKSVKSNNDVAAGDEAGTHLASMLASSPSYNGKGVVVGVIDTGIDTTMDAFKDEDGNSRISYFWNMEVNDKKRYPTVVTPEGESRTYSYGSEYTSADIDAQSEKNPVCTDEYGHGTHVCGTIGGRDDKYPGMAPAVNFIVVNNTTEDESNEDDIWLGAGSGSTLDALEYVISRAEEMGMPLVVNISQGTNLGPHDGSTLFEQAIQADIEERNLIVCISSGNDQDSGKNAQVTIPAGGSEEVTLNAEVLYTEFDDDWLPGAIDIWSTGNPALDMTIKSGEAERKIPYAESIDTYEEFDGVDLACFKEFSSSLNGDDHFLINLHSRDSEEDYDYSEEEKNKKRDAEGDEDDDWWDEDYKDITITFTNTSNRDAVVNLYLQRNTFSMFYDHIEGGTIGIPGSTPGAITVGAYITRGEITDEEGTYDLEQTVGEITAYSSQGPMRTKKLYQGVNAVKPDIVAPGSMLISQMATGYEPFFDFVIDDTHVAFEGTSMSAPVATGTVALILQNMPDATAEQIKEILFDKAMQDEFTGAVPNDIYGHGKLSAASLESSKVVSPQPQISTAARSAENGDNLVIKGSNFTPALDVYINGVLWKAELVNVDGSTMIVVQGVYASDSPLKKSGAVVVETVKVVNRLAKKSANSAEITLRESSGKTISEMRSGSGGCFIATAAYGSYMEPEVMALRRFRDRSLITNAPGRAFVQLYYTYSPPVAGYIAAHPGARWAVRTALTPVVYGVNYPETAWAFAALLGVSGWAVYRRRRLRQEA